MGRYGHRLDTVRRRGHPFDLGLSPPSPALRRLAATLRPERGPAVESAVRYTGQAPAVLECGGRRLGRPRPRGQQRTRCGKLSMCSNEMVPLQIDLAIGLGRYLVERSANPGVREATFEDSTARRSQMFENSPAARIRCGVARPSSAEVRRGRRLAVAAAAWRGRRVLRSGEAGTRGRCRGVGPRVGSRRQASSAVCTDGDMVAVPRGRLLDECAECGVPPPAGSLVAGVWGPQDACDEASRLLARQFEAAALVRSRGFSLPQQPATSMCTGLLVGSGG